MIVPSNDSSGSNKHKAFIVPLTCLALFIVPLILCGCSGETTTTTTTIRPITRVFLHTRTHVSFMVPEEDSKEIKNVHVYCGYHGKVTFVADVEAGDTMWAKKTIVRDRDGVKTTSIEIHIHSEKSVEGAGWNRGKHGSGRTIVVE